MAEVILKQDQSYISESGIIRFGKKGDSIKADDKFLNLIRDKFTVATKDAEPEDDIIDKPINKMNKTELINLVKERGIEISDDDLEAMTKAQIIDNIQKS